MRRLGNTADRTSCVRLHEVRLEQSIASFKTAPEELIWDVDATDKPLLVQQEAQFFHRLYDC